MRSLEVDAAPLLALFSEIAFRSSIGHAVPASARAGAVSTGTAGAFSSHDRRHLRRGSAQQGGSASEVSRARFLAGANGAIVTDERVATTSGDTAFASAARRVRGFGEAGHQQNREKNA